MWFYFLVCCREYVFRFQNFKFLKFPCNMMFRTPIQHARLFDFLKPSTYWESERHMVQASCEMLHCEILQNWFCYAYWVFSIWLFTYSNDTTQSCWEQISWIPKEKRDKVFEKFLNLFFSAAKKKKFKSNYYVLKIY